MLPEELKDAEEGQIVAFLMNKWAELQANGLANRAIVIDDLECPDCTCQTFHAGSMLLTKRLRHFYGVCSKCHYTVSKVIPWKE